MKKNKYIYIIIILVALIIFIPKITLAGGSGKNINVYANELKYNSDENKELINITTTSTTSQTMRLNYDSLCSDNNIKSAVKIIGYIILVIKWIVPLIIIVLGMIDFGKAAISNDEKAVNKATGALIRRFIAGIVIFFIPTIIMAALNAIQISKGIEKDTNTTFGACTKCLFDPVNSCSVVNNTTTGSN
ncbi:MAG: hypothetical protein IJY87_04080 [Bacilli bacterium]|nr:hypothetical protein [Bacilli bacterium]